MRLKLIVLIGVLALLAMPVTAGAHDRAAVPGLVEATERAAKEAAEQQTRENTEREERKAKAAEEKKAGEERQQHEETEHAKAQHEEATGQAGEAGTTQCVVPALKGDTLTQARQALRRAHCKLGRVTAPHGGHGRHVVTRQGLRAGSKHPSDAAVAVMLGPVKLGR